MNLFSGRSENTDLQKTFVRVGKTRAFLYPLGEHFVIVDGSECILQDKIWTVHRVVSNNFSVERNDWVSWKFVFSRLWSQFIIQTLFDCVFRVDTESTAICA